MCVILHLHTSQIRRKEKTQQKKEQNRVNSAHRILIVDDDHSVCKSLSIILELEGYSTTIATTAEDALNLLNKQHFDVILLDVKLADKNGLHILQSMNKTAPETIKIVITGYPSMRNITDAYDLGADGYIMKPVTPQELIRTINSKIEAREQYDAAVKSKLAEMAKLQTTKAASIDFHEFLQEMTKELTAFGLTTNQAKVYVTIVSIGLASASEIAKTARIRREEVYRITSELEKLGIVSRKIDKPQKFSALPPEDATLVLIKSKLSKAAQEIDELDSKRHTIALRIKKVESLPTRIPGSIDKIPATENLCSRLMSMANKANKNIDAILPYKSVIQMYWASQNEKAKPNKNHIKIDRTIAPKVRIITESKACIDNSILIKQLYFAGCEVSVKAMDPVPFSAFVIDNTEALWGQFAMRDDKNNNLWTNDLVQITILKTAFENLWKKATTCIT